MNYKGVYTYRGPEPDWTVFWVCLGLWWILVLNVL